MLSALGPGAMALRGSSFGTQAFYGWRIVAVLAVFSAVTVALAGPNMAVFIQPMIDDLGWRPSTFGWAQFARLEAVILAGPIIGRLLDRYGPRFPITIATVVTGGLVVSLAFVTAEWQLIAIFLATGLLGMGRVADLFVQVPVAKWFVRRRGIAMGIAMAGIPLGVAVFYPVSQLAINTLGWRNTWLVLGVAGALVAAPLALAVLRRQPEDLGLLPDGDTKRDRSRPGETQAALETSWTRAQALRTRSFWVLIVGFTAFTYGWSSLSIFRVPHFVERGLDPTLVALTISLDATIAIGASIAAGRVLDWAPANRIMLLGLVALSVSAASAILVDNVFWLLATNIGYGLGFQVGHVAQNVLWARFFGRRHMGDIQGAALPLTMGLGALAFPLTGYVREATGAYTLAWAIAIGCFALAAMVLMLARPPARDPGGAESKASADGAERAYT